MRTTSAATTRRTTAAWRAATPAPSGSIVKENDLQRASCDGVVDPTAMPSFRTVAARRNRPCYDPSMARGSGKRIIVLLVLALAVGIEVLCWVFLAWRDTARGVPTTSTTSTWGTAVAVTSVGLVAFVAWLIFGRRARG